MDAPSSPPSAERLTLHVSGMTCGTCALQVRKALREVPGVLEAEVSFATGGARVVRGVGEAPDAMLLAAVVRAGYGATVALPARQELARREAEEAREASAWLLRAVLGGAGTAAILLLHGHPHPGAPVPWAALLLAGAMQAALGLPFYRGALRAVRALTGNMDLLVSLGATAGFVLSTAATFGKVSAPGVHLDCAPAVLSVVSLGKYLEARARRQAGKAVRGLVEMVPPKALVLREGVETELGVEEVRVGDRVRVPPNAAVPVDGEIVSGASRVDESSLTGEPLPVGKGAGDHVSAGTRNGEGALEIRAERVGEETLLGQVAARVESAQASRASASRLADRVAAGLVPAVLLAAGAAALWNGWTAATAVLLAACPCALGLAIPAALAVGVGLAARHGVLFRDVEALERAAKVRAVFFDKTGTLTTGASRVAWFWAAPGTDANETLALAAAAERHEDHPAARAIRAHAGGGRAEVPTRVESVPGGGVRAELRGREVLVGSAGFLRARGVDLPALEAKAAEAERGGQGSVCVAVDGREAGLFALEESARPESLRAVKALREMGLSVGMLSGDRPERAHALAGALGIAEVHAGVLPQGKAELLRSAGARLGGPAAMVGDGVNDAAALASAQLGIALGTGAGLAKDAAGVTLLGGDLSAVPWTVSLARATRRVVLENLAWAFAYNLAAVPLAMTGRLSPWQAAGLMALSDLVVLGNALTLPWRVRPWGR